VVLLEARERKSACDCRDEMLYEITTEATVGKVNVALRRPGKVRDTRGKIGDEKPRKSARIR